jgi:hypothetical protein
VLVELPGIRLITKSTSSGWMPPRVDLSNASNASKGLSGEETGPFRVRFSTFWTVAVDFVDAKVNEGDICSSSGKA